MTKMTATATSWLVTIPAGTYFLGDPCYAVPDDSWMPLLESCGYFDATDDPKAGPVGEFTSQDEKGPVTVQVVAFSTAYGDGEYVDQYGETYAVDAGLIGLTPVLPAPGWRYANNELEDLGRIVTFDQDTTASTDGEGRLRFGTYEIDTAEADAEEDRW